MTRNTHMTMERDDYRCFRCGVPLANVWAGYSCHHRQSRSVGPDTPDNLIMLCGSGSSPHCHFYVHQHPAESRDKGWIISKYIDRDSIPDIPAYHYRLGMVTLSPDGEVHAPA